MGVSCIESQLMCFSLGAVLTPRGHWVKSGGSFGCHNWGSEWYGHLKSRGKWCCYTVHRDAPCNRELSSQEVNNARTETLRIEKHHRWKCSPFTLCVCVCVCGITVTQLIETLIFLRWEHEQETANETWTHLGAYALEWHISSRETKDLCWVMRIKNLQRCQVNMFTMVIKNNPWISGRKHEEG